MAASPSVAYLARAPCAAPASAPPEPRQPRVRIRHPGYATNNVLLRMPAIDCLESSVPLPSTTSPGAGPSQDTPQIKFGLHHRTALTAGAIIANNAFDRAYFTHDQAGRKRVDVPLDCLLEPGDYWLQLRGEEPPSLGAGQTAHTTGEEPGEAASTTLASMPPPPRPPARAQSALSEPRSASTKYKPYPIVPSFTDWRFPHNRVPAEWRATHETPGHSLQPPTRPAKSSPTSTLRSRCCITDYSMGTNRCHVVPSKQKDWFSMNEMHEYVSGLIGNIHDEANLITLRADLHLLFDQRKFAMAPKPSAFIESAATSSILSVDERYALTIHVLNDDEGADEFSGPYHNVAIQPKAVEMLSRDFVFARFAWSLFPLLQNFLETPIPRRLAVISKTNENGVWLSRVSSDLANPQTEWMNYEQYLRHLHQRGESRSGSRKRTSSQMSRNEEAADDEYEERWPRRSNSLDRAHARAILLTPDQRSLEENTEWYEQHGRYAAIDFSPDDWEDDIYSKRGRSRTRESRQ